MRDRNHSGQSGPSKEARRRKVSPEDIQALQRRAADWPKIGGHGRARVHAQSRALFELYLDFLRAGVLGLDFPRWFAVHSGVPRTTCRRYLKAGEALDVGSKANRNQSGLVAEQVQRSQTPGPEVDWD